jgi:hypothetical protein
MAVRLLALRTGRPSPPGRFLVLISVRAWVDPRAIVRLEGLDKLKNPVTSSGMKPATSRLVSIVPQPTTLPHDHTTVYNDYKKYYTANYGLRFEYFDHVNSSLPCAPAAVKERIRISSKTTNHSREMVWLLGRGFHTPKGLQLHRLTQLWRPWKYEHIRIADSEEID